MLYSGRTNGRSVWSINDKSQCDAITTISLLLPENEIIFRTKDARALRNLCRQLRWQIAVDTTLSIDDWTEPPVFNPAKVPSPGGSPVT